MNTVLVTFGLQIMSATVMLLFSIFTQRIKDISLQNWRRSINDSPKVDHYKYFKTQLDVEKYLSIDLSFICRKKKKLASFRCSSHNLQMEKSRHSNIEREYRFFPFCLERNVYIIEDIFHNFFLWYVHCILILDQSISNQCGDYIRRYKSFIL